MAAVEKWTCFGERQLFSERTQFLKIFALELEFRFQPFVSVQAIKSYDCSWSVPAKVMYSLDCRWRTKMLSSCALFFALWRANVLRLAQQLTRHELRAWAVLATQETRHRRGVGILVGLPKRGA